MKKLAVGLVIALHGGLAISPVNAQPIASHVVVGALSSDAKAALQVWERVFGGKVGQMVHDSRNALATVVGDGSLN